MTKVRRMDPVWRGRSCGVGGGGGARAHTDIMRRMCAQMARLRQRRHDVMRALFAERIARQRRMLRRSEYCCSVAQSACAMACLRATAWMANCGCSGSPPIGNAFVGNGACRRSQRMALSAAPKGASDARAQIDEMGANPCAARLIEGGGKHDRGGDDALCQIEVALSRFATARRRARKPPSG